MKEETGRLITAVEIGNYVVCPEAWRLKYLVKQSYSKASDDSEVRTLRRDWIKSQELSSQLRSYAKIVFLLLLLLVVVLLFADVTKTGHPAIDNNSIPSSTPTESSHE